MRDGITESLEAVTGQRDGAEAKPGRGAGCRGADACSMLHFRTSGYRVIHGTSRAAGVIRVHESTEPGADGLARIIGHGINDAIPVHTARRAACATMSA